MKIKMKFGKCMKLALFIKIYVSEEGGASWALNGDQAETKLVLKNI